MLEEIMKAVEYIRSKTSLEAKTGIILGTGLNQLAERAEIETVIPYGEIPGFVKSTVAEHKGNLIFGRLEGHPVVMMQGRFHFYEGYTMQQVVFPVRVMKYLGINQLLISNAAGAINLNYKPASLMLLDDHLNFIFHNPLVGPNDNRLGERFPDMSCPYDRKLNRLFKEIAAEQHIDLNEGVYAAWIGPNFETRAEYRFLKVAGADAVGMSTVPEVIAANHIGLPVAAISVITDLCDPKKLVPAKLSDILHNADVAEVKLSKLFSEIVKRL